MPAAAPPPVNTRLLYCALLRSGGLAPDRLESLRLGEIYIMMQFACDLRCAACSLWGGTGALHQAGAAAREPAPGSEPDWIGFLRQAAPLKPGMVNFSGGEPLLHDRWLAPAKEARRLGIETLLTTNGIHLEERLGALCGSIDQINLSLNGPPRISGQIRKGPKGHYEKMMRGLRLFMKIKRAMGQKAPRLRLMCTVFDGNAGHLLELLSYLKANGVEADQYHFQHLIYHTASELSEQERELKKMGMSPWFTRGYSLLPRGLDSKALSLELAEITRSDNRVSLSAALKGKALADYYRGLHGWTMPAYCAAPWRDITVLPDGDIWICPDYRIGNLRERTFPEIWEGTAARNLRARLLKRLLPGCRGCFHYYCDKQTKI